VSKVNRCPKAKNSANLVTLAVKLKDELGRQQKERSLTFFLSLLWTEHRHKRRRKLAENCYIDARRTPPMYVRGYFHEISKFGRSTNIELSEIDHGCHIFLAKTHQNRKNIPIGHKLYQTSIT
jgi:hypothetical protein